MATSTLLSNPVVTINAIDVSDNVTSAVLHINYTQLNATAFGSVDSVYVKGLGDHSLDIEMYNSYAASETWATLKDLVGTTTTVKIKPTSAATSATNPEVTLTGTFLAELPPNFSLGALSTVSISFTGGVYSVATS